MLICVHWLVRVTAKAVEVAHFGIHHRILAPRPQAIDQILKLNLILEVVTRDAARLAVIVLAELEVPCLNSGQGFRPAQLELGEYRWLAKQAEGRALLLQALVASIQREVRHTSRHQRQ